MQLLNLEKKNVRSIINARTLQMIVGCIGLAFPIVVPLGAYALTGLPLQSSLSAYYYTATGDLLVGSLCAIGVCLLAYLGPQSKDNIAGDVAGVCAIGVALFPTFETEPTGWAAWVWIGWAHAVFAGIFFFTLAVFAGYLFTKSDKMKPLSKKKLRRNWFYRICAVTILICLLGIGATFFLSDSIASARAIYWFEAIGIFAFGFSWFVKSEPRWLTYFSDP